MTKTIDGPAFAQMIFCASAALDSNRQQLNDLNVFPVPDGDTGTNMSLTMASAAAALRENTPAAVGEAAGAAAAALLRGARGNSGVITSLLFRGISKSLRGKTECSAADWAAAMNKGVSSAYKAVMKPAEGTILTVSRLASERAEQLTKGGIADIEEVLTGALEAANEALADTVNQNPVLKKAGVVDAGGQGYVVIFNAMLLSLQGKFSAAPASVPVAEAVAAEPREEEQAAFTYLCEYTVHREKTRDAELLRSYLESIGGGLVMDADEKSIHVKLYTDAPGRALTEGLRYGSLQTVKVENLRPVQENPEDEIAPAEKAVGFVAVCTGDGMKELFTSLGADRVVTGGQTMNPSTEDILREVNKTPAETVFVFPNNKNIIMAAEQCVKLCKQKIVRVVPTKTVPQGVTALACMDPEADADSLDASFRESAERVHTALVTYAARDSDFDGHSIHAGEYLTLLDGKMLGNYDSVESMLGELCAAFGPLTPEFLTVYYGQDVTDEAAQDVSGALSAAFPDSDVSLVNGGQPVYYYMISAE
ncbi:MAG: DAK2 domain-containing protein [Oscillospiraceae bacterium]|nr:DAK2 domain-containing protein [Oscillospiraceae bacterium]